MKDIVVFDLDGTLADISHRLHFIEKEKKDWDSFFLACSEDKPIQWICNLLYQFGVNLGFKIGICTGRSDIAKEETLNWLHKYNVFYDELLMRKQGDHRHDTKVKPELLKYKPEEVFLIIEDRSTMVKRWRELGYKVLQPFEGNF